MRQIIEVQLSETNPSPNSNFTIDVIYSTADPVDETLLGIALNLHYDSSALTLDLNDLSNVLQTSIFGNPQISADTDDLDSDPATDSILLLNWSDLNGNWPGVGTTPATLYTAEFTTSGDFAATTINFTAKTVPGFELDAQPVSIGAQVVNQAPTLNDATFSVAENSAVDTAVETVIATDPDAGDTLTYSIESGAFTIDTATGAITVADSSQLDFETTTSFPLTVTVTDQGALSDTATVTVSLTNVDEAPKLVFTTPGDDVLEPELTPNAQITFTGAGVDQIDAVVANSTAPDRFYAGSENDRIFAGTNDRLFGELGNDILDASQRGGGNRLYGNEDNDELIAGTGDVLVGGLGNDTLESNAGGGENYLFGNEGDDFFSLRQNDTVFGGSGDDSFSLNTGGNNTIQGNEGADTFIIVSGELPAGANTITDFSVEDGDIISIGSNVDQELNEFADLTLTVGVDTQWLSGKS